MSQDTQSKLAIYLNDHLGMMVGESQLIDRVSNENSGTEFGQFLVGYGTAVKEQQAVLRQTMERTEAAPSTVKEAVGWLAEKVGRLKLNDSLVQYTDLARLLETEGLMAAAALRRQLWTTLAAGDLTNVGVQDIDFGRLATETAQQVTELQNWHEHAVQRLFSN